MLKIDDTRIHFRAALERSADRVYVLAGVEEVIVQDVVARHDDIECHWTGTLRAAAVSDGVIPLEYDETSSEYITGDKGLRMTREDDPSLVAVPGLQRMPALLSALPTHQACIDRQPGHSAPLFFLQFLANA